MRIRQFLFILGFIFYSDIFAIEVEAELKKIDFKQRNDISFLDFIFDKGNIQVNNFHVKDDKQIIVDFKNVQASPRVLRAFDTSEFSGSIVFVSAYHRPQNIKDIRVVLQLRDNVNSELRKKNNKVTLMVENRFGAFAQIRLKGSESTVSSTGSQMGEGRLKINIPKSQSMEDILDNIALSGPTKYIGKKISLNVKNLSIENVLKMIAKISGFNVILSNEAKDSPPITLFLVDTPWDQVLDTILELNNLVPERKGSILVVHDQDVLAKKRDAIEKAREAMVNKKPLETRVIPISYAKMDELSEILTPYLTKDRGNITSDERTNSLIIEDKLEVIERMKKIIEILDVQTPQILIASKIIDVSQDYQKELGLLNGFSFTSDFSPGVPRGSLTRNGPEFNFSSVGEAGGSAGTVLGFSLGIGRIRNLDFLLQLHEQEAKIKTIASPKIITQNNKAATITATDTEPFAVTVVDPGGQTQNTYDNAEASTNMSVTPQVTNEGSIMMNITVSRSTFGNRAPGSSPPPPPTATRSVNTNVLIDNGSTVVIGGLYSSTEERRDSGIPVLKDIPLVGWLFRNPYRQDENKTEMMIFLTPTVINEEESGLIERELPQVSS